MKADWLLMPCCNCSCVGLVLHLNNLSSVWFNVALVYDLKRHPMVEVLLANDGSTKEDGADSELPLLPV